MSTGITVEMIRKMAAKMKENEIPPRTVKTRKEARELTANDPVGHVWSVGDKYYLVAEKNCRWAVVP